MIVWFSINTKQVDSRSPFCTLFRHSTKAHQNPFSSKAKEVASAAAEDAVRQMDMVHEGSVEAFTQKAKELIEERGAEVALAASIAALTGHFRELTGRSLLSAYEGYLGEVFVELDCLGWKSFFFGVGNGKQLEILSSSWKMTGLEENPFFFGRFIQK